MESTSQDISEQEENERVEQGKTVVSGGKRFRWDKNDKVENLIRCLANYKS